MIRRNSFRLGSSHNVGIHKITIRLLDDNEILQLDVQSHHKGQYLMDFVCRQLNIAEKDYFALRYVDSNKQRHWLDLGKPALKQLKDMSPLITCLRFKFYPSDSSLLKENVTRYQLVLQLRRDMLHGRLYSNASDMATLASYIIQSELGDYDPEVHVGNYISEYELISRQTPEFEEMVIELHQKLKGKTADESDEAFMKKAISLDTYGIDPHPVKDQQGEQVYLGINHTGISTFQGSKKSTHFKWSQITKLNYEAKMFIIHICLSEESRNRKKETVGFKCQSFSACKYLWCCAVEQRLFFNFSSSNDIPNSVRGGGLFGTRFRYSGRVQKEVLDDPGPLRVTDGTIQRTPLYRSLQRNKTNSLQSSPLQEYGTLPRANNSAPLHESTRIDAGFGPAGSSTSLPMSTSPYSPDHTTPMLETLMEDSPKSGELEVTENLQTQIVNGDATFISEAPEVEENEKSYNLVNGIGQSEFQEPLSPLTFPSSLHRISEELEPEAEMGFNLDSNFLRKQIPQDLSLDKNSTYDDQTQYSPNYVIASLLATPPTPEVDFTEPSFPLSRNKKLERLDNFDESEKESETQFVDDDSKSSTPQHINDFTQRSLSSSVDNPNDSLVPSSAFCTTALSDNKPFPKHELLGCDPNSNLVKLVDTFDAAENLQGHSDRSPIGAESEGVESDTTLRDSKIDASTSSDKRSDNAAGDSLKWHKRNSQDKLLSIWKIFVVSFVCVFLAALIVAVIVIETNLDICTRMRRIPEVEFFSHEIYFPFKLFVRDKFASVSRIFR